MNAFVITLREGIEAALVIGIVIAFLRRVDRSEMARWVFGGAAAGAVFSVIAALVLHGLGLGADNPLVEAILYVVAAAVVVTMVVWMMRSSKGTRGRIEGRIGSVLASGRSVRASAFALFALSFFMVAREGVETALFLAASALGGASGATLLAGGVLGLAAAVTYGVVFARGGGLIDLRLFFILTSIALAVLAVKLVIGSVHEFEEAGVIPMSETLAHAFDAMAASSLVDVLFLFAVGVPFLAPVIRRVRGGHVPQRVPVAK